MRRPFNTKEGLENLNYAARSIKGDPVKAIMTSALRALFVDKITSDYYKAADEYAENEFNQEYWSGQHCDSHSQEYPEDWVKRTQQRPRHTTFSNSNY